MMNSAKQFSRQPFDVKFAQARQHIYEYLELGREAQSRTYRRTADQKASQQAGKITHAKKKPKWGRHEIALELDMSYSFIHQAKKTAQQCQQAVQKGSPAYLVNGFSSFRFGRRLFFSMRHQSDLARPFLH